MKKLFLFSALLLIPLVGSSQSDKVYICTGQYATTYHRTSNCSGLGNCKADVIQVTLTEALRMQRNPCKRCYK